MNGEYWIIDNFTNKFDQQVICYTLYCNMFITKTHTNLLLLVCQYSFICILFTTKLHCNIDSIYYIVMYVYAYKEYIVKCAKSVCDEYQLFINLEMHEILLYKKNLLVNIA